MCEVGLNVARGEGGGQKIQLNQEIDGLEGPPRKGGWWSGRYVTKKDRALCNRSYPEDAF